MPQNCILCKEHSFEDNASLAAHLYEVHEAVYNCSYCYNQYMTKEEKDLHIERRHTSQAYFGCVICGAKTIKKKELLQHQKDTHRNLEELTCKDCSVVFADKDFLNMHKRYCPARRQPTNTQPASSHSSPSQRSSVHVCQYCHQSFRNRDDHCRHLIEVHQAGVLCSFCDHQLQATPGDEDGAKDIFQQHLAEWHKRPGYWPCIYCGRIFGDGNKLRAHQDAARHGIISCHVCAVLTPSETVSSLHRNYQHKNDASGPSSRRSDPTTDSRGFCLCCLKRFPMEELRDHLHEDGKQGLLVSCNECFSFIDHPHQLQHHLRCFEEEAKRHAILSNGKSDPSNLTRCNCGFCANDQNQLTRHQDWCHKRSSCQTCNRKLIGEVGLRNHICPNAPQRKSPITQPESGIRQQQQGSLVSFNFARPSSIRFDSDPRQRVQSFSSDRNSVTATPPHIPSPMDAASANVVPMELPDTPEVDIVKREPPDAEEIDVLQQLHETTEGAMTPKEKGKGQETVHKKNSAATASSSDSSDDDAPLSARQSKMFLKRPLEKTKLFGKNAPIQPKVQPVVQSRKPSSSSSSSSSDDDRQRATKPKPYIPAQKAPNQRLINFPRIEDSSSSDTSSSDDEPPAKKRNTVVPAKNKSAPSPGRRTMTVPMITSVFTVPKSASAAASAGTSSRQNVFATAAKLTSTVMPAQSVEFVCALCDQSSPYKQNVIRHLEGIHRLPGNRCSDFCQVRVFKPCSECKAWKKKVQLREKLLKKLLEQIVEVKESLTEEKD